jgi:signal transduction histidine kinase
MRLSQFILSNLESILAEWESFASTIFPESKFDKIALRDAAGEILKAIANDIETAQTSSQQAEKSKGHGVRTEEDSAAEIHAADRLGLGFNQAQVVSEYRALRATVLRLWIDSSPELDHSAIDQLIRFNEGIDQALSESTARFMQEIEESRDLAIAVMAHDLRNPLNAIVSSAQMIQITEGVDKGAINTLASIVHSGMHMSKLIENLLDFTRTRFGQPLVVKRESMDLAQFVGRRSRNSWRPTRSERSV